MAYHSWTDSKRFFNSLHSNHTVKELYMYRCELGYSGAQLIAEAIKKNRTITKLSLDWCKIGPVGGNLLAIP